MEGGTQRKRSDGGTEERKNEVEEDEVEREGGGVPRKYTSQSIHRPKQLNTTPPNSPTALCSSPLDLSRLPVSSSCDRSRVRSRWIQSRSIRVEERERDTEKG